LLGHGDTRPGFPPAEKSRLPLGEI
jgi:hypothetical protein